MQLLCFALQCFALLCFALLCLALLCFALLCLALICFALLCFAFLCFPFLCFALLVRVRVVFSCSDEMLQFGLCCFALRFVFSCSDETLESLDCACARARSTVGNTRLIRTGGFRRFARAGRRTAESDAACSTRAAVRARPTRVTHAHREHRH